MTRYVAWLMKQTLQKVAERFAIKCEGQCEFCPKYINWRECKAYHSRNICDCVKEFEEWLKEEVEPNHEEAQDL